MILTCCVPTYVAGIIFPSFAYSASFSLPRFNLIGRPETTENAH